MDIKSLSEDVVLVDGYFDLFKSTIKYRVDAYNLLEYTVKEEDEMRIDLIFQKMYSLPIGSVKDYLENIDVICTINNLDNPLNIKKGMILKYPEELSAFTYFRITTEEDLRSKKKSLTNKLGVPNKKTRTDSSRKDYVDNGYSLPPTVNSNPRKSVTIENGKFKIGGL